MDDNSIQRSFGLLIAKMSEICSQGVNVPHYKEDCYWYREWQDMNARIPYCKYRKFPADTIGPNDCESCKQYHSKYKPSNADRIRAMTDEELAEWLAEVLFHCSNTICDQRCPMYKCCCDQPSDNIEDWLKQEVTND